MKVFVTGGTGLIGTAVIQELIRAGHQVVGLSRSAENTAKLQAAGASVHNGSLEDLASLTSGAGAADGVIHCAFNHDFSKFAENGVQEQRAIAALTEGLAGSGKPLVVTSGVALLTPGKLANEETVRPSDSPIPRDPETAAMTAAGRGVRAIVIRMSPSVHDGQRDKHGFTPTMIKAAKEKGVSAYVGDGTNVWPAVHLLDAAALYRLALEKGRAGSRYHAVAEEGVLVKDIAAAISKKFNLPLKSMTREEAGAHFGWFAMFSQINQPASSSKTREELGWKPTHLQLVSDILENYP